jgi:hypothetical protein
MSEKVGCHDTDKFGRIETVEKICGLEVEIEPPLFSRALSWPLSAPQSCSYNAGVFQCRVFKRR